MILISSLVLLWIIRNRTIKREGQNQDLHVLVAKSSYQYAFDKIHLHRVVLILFLNTIPKNWLWKYSGDVVVLISIP